MHGSSVYVRVAGPNRRISLYALLKGKSLTSVISLFFMNVIICSRLRLPSYIFADLRASLLNPIMPGGNNKVTHT